MILVRKLGYKQPKVPLVNLSQKGIDAKRIRLLTVGWEGWKPGLRQESGKNKDS